MPVLSVILMFPLLSVLVQALSLSYTGSILLMVHLYALSVVVCLGLF